MRQLISRHLSAYLRPPGPRSFRFSAIGCSRNHNSLIECKSCLWIYIQQRRQVSPHPPNTPLGFIRLSSSSSSSSLYFIYLIEIDIQYNRHGDIYDDDVDGCVQYIGWCRKEVGGVGWGGNDVPPVIIYEKNKNPTKRKKKWTKKKIGIQFCQVTRFTSAEGE